MAATRAAQGPLWSGGRDWIGWVRWGASAVESRIEGRGETGDWGGVPRVLGSRGEYRGSSPSRRRREQLPLWENGGQDMVLFSEHGGFNGFVFCFPWFLPRLYWVRAVLCFR